MFTAIALYYSKMHTYEIKVQHLYTNSALFSEYTIEATQLKLHSSLFQFTSISVTCCIYRQTI